MASSLEDLDAEILALQQTYARELPRKISRIADAWPALGADPWDREAVGTLRRMIHSLAGSGATFGYSAITSSARDLERYLQPIIERGSPPSLPQQAQLEALLEAVRAAGAHPDAECGAETGAPLPPASLAPEGAAALIFLVEADPVRAEDLARQIRYFGYTVHTAPHLADLPALRPAARPAALIVDLALRAGDLPGLDALAGLSQDPVAGVPRIFISERTDLAARLQAVHAGGAAYFTAPVDVGVLVDTLDQLTAPHAAEPYRVLIVDDEPALARRHALILQRGGMTTAIVTEPLQIMGPLAALKPDLILMDLYMPGCTGLDLAAVLRQQEAYVGIPIVFLSGETDMDKQLVAMRLGGDDFLTKPIQPDHLIAAVSSRVERARTMRSFMVRDGLTGLLNHTIIKERLYVEIDRAQRDDMPLVFAILDMDHFKLVNDTYGHPTGDRVLKSLARLLQQRLRKTDLIGRYGGEEFAVILPHTEVVAAARVLDDLRAGFSQIRHQADGAEFYLTFSGGLACFPGHADATTLTDAADKALYRAKQSGRNRVLTADTPGGRPAARGGN